MRYALFAAALLSAAPAFAQQTEMDAAEAELRRDMAPAGATIERVSPDEVRVVMPSDITFDFDRATIRREFEPRLRDLARTLTQRPSLRVDIIGHADALGSDEYNQDLSERRARSVTAGLIHFGVPVRRISASGMGEFEPVASNATEWGRARNRRVEIRVRTGGGGRK
ncbi:MAG: OmpA family protein [Hyphomonadaceae bacterium]